MSQHNHISFPVGGILILMFSYFKITGAITWSWWWVFAPIWLPLTVIAGVFAVVFIGAVLIDAYDNIR